MRFDSIICVLAAAAIAAATPVRASGPETIAIAEGEKTLRAVLYRPEGAEPFPAVIALHGCGGLNTTSAGVGSRYRDWADRLTKAGYVVVFPDSYGSRGLGPQCRVRERPIRTDRERVADANAARNWLRSQPYVNRDRISLLGWSNGGISVLWTIRRQAAPADGNSDFRSAVALYPGCPRLDRTAWSARVPTLILVGAADDWTSARDCERMVAGARGRSARIAIIVYPGAYHDFDHPTRPVQVRTGYAYSVDGSGRVHTGANPAARADAHKRVLNWLAR
jgi:dienelactone hydrolase